MKNSISLSLVAYLVAHCLSASASTSDWRLSGEYPEGDPCHPCPGCDDLCQGPFYDISITNNGVPTPICESSKPPPPFHRTTRNICFRLRPNVLFVVACAASPMAVNTIAPAAYISDYTLGQYASEVNSNCTFTLADGSQIVTNDIFDIYDTTLQAVTTVSCPPLDGSSTSEEEELGTTTRTSFSSSSSSTIGAAATTPPYPTTQEESFTTTTSAISAISAVATTPPYPTTPSNNYTVVGGGTPTAVSSSSIGASSMAAAAAPGRGGDIVPFTGDAPSLRTLCVVPFFALLLAFWVLG